MMQCLVIAKSDSHVGIITCLSVGLSPCATDYSLEDECIMSPKITNQKALSRMNTSAKADNHLKFA